MDTTRSGKDQEFESFIKILEDGAVSHWQQIAETLGVSTRTIVRWKKLPRAQATIQKGINNAIREMEKTGKKDWRMWKEKLALLGIQKIEKTDITSDGERLEAPIIYKPKQNE